SGQRVTSMVSAASRSCRANFAISAGPIWDRIIHHYLDASAGGRVDGPGLLIRRLHPAYRSRTVSQVTEFITITNGCHHQSSAIRSTREATGIMERRNDTLDGIDIFADLAAEARRALAGRCTWRDFKPHQQILGHQEDSRTVMFLSTGKARATIFSEN